MFAMMKQLTKDARRQDEAMHGDAPCGDGSAASWTGAAR